MLKTIVLLPVKAQSVLTTDESTPPETPITKELSSKETELQ
jgi:hypothetical protein